jgi:NADPH:quinone reductase-like Zn-dependent oxidoreductase
MYEIWLVINIVWEIALEVWPLLASGRIAPVMDSEFALEDAAAAHARMEGGTHIGKIVLKVGG